MILNLYNFVILHLVFFIIFFLIFIIEILQRFVSSPSTFQIPDEFLKREGGGGERVMDDTNMEIISKYKQVIQKQDDEIEKLKKELQQKVEHIKELDQQVLDLKQVKNYY